jgi:hypothetical protein
MTEWLQRLLLDKATREGVRDPRWRQLAQECSEALFENLCDAVKGLVVEYNNAIPSGITPIGIGEARPDRLEFRCGERVLVIQHRATDGAVEAWRHAVNLFGSIENQQKIGVAHRWRIGEELLTVANGSRVENIQSAAQALTESYFRGI